MTTVRAGVCGVALFALLAVRASAGPQEHIVVQRDLAFSTNRLLVQAGDTVRFVNVDGVEHNAYVAEGKAVVFDTGMMTKGDSKAIRLDAPGIHEVRCAVHPGMRMTIEVKDAAAEASR